MKHNLFTHPTEVLIEFDEDGQYKIEKLIESQNIMDVLGEMNYDKSSLDDKLKELIAKSNFMNEDEKAKLLLKLSFYLSENSYLKTIQANQD